MAIQTKKDQNLVETLITNEKIATSTGNKMSEAKNTSKTSFLKSVFVELTKVKWPSPKYVASWSVMVVIFTGCFSILLGSADHVFESGISFVSCSSPKGKSRDLGSCSQDLLKKLFFVENK